MTNSDTCLEAARKAYPNDEELRVAYMMGFGDGYDRAKEEQSLPPKLDNAAKYHRVYGLYGGYINLAMEDSFKAGAEWADKNPNPQAVAEFLYKEKGYPITLNGEILSFEEAIKDVQIYNAHMKKQWIEKACNWLSNNLLASDLEKLSYNVMTEKSKALFIENFRKAMEE